MDMAHGEWTSALANLQQMVQSDPGNVKAINNMAVCYIYLGQLSEVGFWRGTCVMIVVT